MIDFGQLESLTLNSQEKFNKLKAFFLGPMFDIVVIKKTEAKTEEKKEVENLPNDNEEIVKQKIESCIQNKDTIIAAIVKLLKKCKELSDQEIETIFARLRELHKHFSFWYHPEILKYIGNDEKLFKLSEIKLSVVDAYFNISNMKNRATALFGFVKKQPDDMYLFANAELPSKAQIENIESNIKYFDTNDIQHTKIRKFLSMVLPYYKMTSESELDKCLQKIPNEIKNIKKNIKILLMKKNHVTEKINEIAVEKEKWMLEEIVNIENMQKVKVLKNINSVEKLKKDVEYREKIKGQKENERKSFEEDILKEIEILSAVLEIKKIILHWKEKYKVEIKNEYQLIEQFSTLTLDATVVEEVIEVVDMVVSKTVLFSTQASSTTPTSTSQDKIIVTDDLKAEKNKLTS